MRTILIALCVAAPIIMTGGRAVAQVSDRELQQMMEDVAGTQASRETTATPNNGQSSAFGNGSAPLTPGDGALGRLPGEGTPPFDRGQVGDGEGEAAQAAVPPPPPVVRKWGALAAALWRRRGKVRVSTGSAVRYDTKRAAINAAMRRCRKGGGGKRCKIVTTFNLGCGFIATGRNRRGAGWASGRSRASASRKCRKQGYRCKRPIGGCVQ